MRGEQILSARSILLGKVGRERRDRLVDSRSPPVALIHILCLEGNSNSPVLLLSPAPAPVLLLGGACASSFVLLRGEGKGVVERRGEEIEAA